jgi:hypothetical protein
MIELPFPVEEAIQECEVRMRHRGGELYDHVKASGMLPYLQELQRLQGVMKTLNTLVERGDVNIHFRIMQLEGECVRVALDVQNGFAVTSKTLDEALTRIGEGYL